jgi:hypothetical protein
MHLTSILLWFDNIPKKQEIKEDFYDLLLHSQGLLDGIRKSPKRV